jgi:hypothetical protein
MPYPQLNAFHCDRKGIQVPVIPRQSSLVTRTVNKSAAFKQPEDSRGFRSYQKEGANPEPSEQNTL